MFMLDPNGIITEWTSGAERVKGYTAAEVIGRHLSLFYTAEDVAAGTPQRELAEAAATGRAEREGWRVRKGGERFWVNEIVNAVYDPDGALVGFTKVGRDLSERRRAADVAERARAGVERESLRRRLVLAEEEERRRLARELHDEAGQYLTALGLGLQALSDVTVPGSDVDRRVSQLRRLADALGRELHALSVRLRPRALDDFGLEAALESHTEDWSTRFGIELDVHIDVGTERLPQAVESAVYRIVQEALTNVAKHSGAGRASVVIEERDGLVHAVVEDDGHGFDPGVVERRGGGTGLGLLGIRERAELLGGEMEIESVPGKGTTLFVWFPVEAGRDIDGESRSGVHEQRRDREQVEMADR
jgi:PAS domain S-box-containing protein